MDGIKNIKDSEEKMAMRLKEFQKNLTEQKIDAALLLSLGMEPDPSFFYFTQYAGAGALLIPQNGKPTLFAPRMEAERAKKSLISNVKIWEKKRLFDSLKDELKGVKTAGLEFSTMNHALFLNFKKKMKGVKAFDVAKILDDLRTIKTKKEVSYLKTSCKEADSIIQKCIKNFKEFKTEADASAFLQYETFKRGLDVSFKPIVASGKNGSMPHYTPSTKPLNSGLCVIDFGVKYKGYCSDITRTVGLKGVPKEQREKYAKLLDIQLGAIDNASKAQTCGEVYDGVVSDLGKDAQFFTHGLGHGVGVEIHEYPNLTNGSKDPIQKNIVFTIEPGVYYPKKFGIRIEDTILFDKKAVTLTKTAKELVVI